MNINQNGMKYRIKFKEAVIDSEGMDSLTTYVEGLESQIEQLEYDLEQAGIKLDTIFRRLGEAGLKFENERSIEAPDYVISATMPHMTGIGRKPTFLVRGLINGMPV